MQSYVVCLHYTLRPEKDPPPQTVALLCVCCVQFLFKLKTKSGLQQILPAIFDYNSSQVNFKQLPAVLLLPESGARFSERQTETLAIVLLIGFSGLFITLPEKQQNTCVMYNLASYCVALLHFSYVVDIGLVISVRFAHSTENKRRFRQAQTAQA